MSEAAGEVTPAIPAATVVLIRDGQTGDRRTELEVLMLQRTSKVSFGGMWVFPGGRVDEGDRHPDDPADAELAVQVAAQRAAVREAAEECGLIVDPIGIEALSRWTPPPMADKRYATWFFLARVPDGDVVVDGSEILDHVWLTPADALTRREGGQFDLAPPTWVTVHSLIGLADVDAALEMARSRRPVPSYETRWCEVDGGAVAMWRGDAGYDSSTAGMAGDRHRLWMLEAGWRFELT